MTPGKQAFCGMAFAMLATSTWASSDPYIPLPPLGPDVGQIQVAAVQPLGQSFTALASSVGSIWLNVINMNMDFQLAQDKTLTLQLHAGGNLGGPVLGSSTVDVDALLGGLRGTESLVEFNFGHVPVLNGQTYSFEVKAVTARYGVSMFNEGHYDGGQALLLGAASTADLYFGVAAAPVPEPAARQLLLLGLAAGLGGIRLLQRRTRHAPGGA